MANEKIHEYLNQRTNLNLLGSEFFDVDATDDLGVSWFSAKVLLIDLLTWLNENGLNIYYSDGTLQGDRTITANTHFTRWLGGDVMIVHVDRTNEHGFIINDADYLERARLGLNQNSNSGKLELRNGLGEFLNAVNNIVRIGYGSNGIAKFTEVKEATSNILFTAVGLTGGDEVLKILHEITNGDVNIAEKIEITGTNSENIGVQITATGATENNAVKANSGNIVASSGQIYSSIPTTHVPTGTTQTINWDGGNGQVIDLGSATGDVTLTLNNPKSGGIYFIKIIQGSTPRNITFPANVIWSDNSTPVITKTDDAVDFVHMKYDGVIYYAEIIQDYGNNSPVAHLDDISYQFAASDEVTPLIADPSQAAYTDYMAVPITVNSVMINVNTAPTGDKIIVDIKKNGTTIFTTPISIDATENTSLTASVPYVLAGTITFAVGDKIEAFITQVGSTVAGSGLKIKLL